MSPEEQIATVLDPLLGEHFSDVEFADFVDEVLDDLAGLSASVGGR